MSLFIVVQANGLPPTSFPLSSLLSSPHNPSKLNNKIIERKDYFFGVWLQKLIFVCKYQKLTLGKIFINSLHYVLQMFSETVWGNPFNVFDPTYFISVECFNYRSKIVKEPELVTSLVCVCIYLSFYFTFCSKLV